MGMAIATTERWTIERLRALPDDRNRYEIVDGELFVTPSPSFPHQDAVASLFLQLRSYAVAHRVAHVLTAPADVEYDEHTVVEPDILAMPLREGRKPRSWQEAGRLLLAVEVLSPRTARADRTVKRQLYQRQGVPQYWIVDLDARIVERWRPGDERPEIVTQRLEWQPDPAHPPLVIGLVHFFAEIAGD